MLEIHGIAFLWHMIRCIMSVLILVGQGFENPDVVLWLLNVDACPSKPAYTMAGELPLVLHSCVFENLSLKMQPRVLWSLTAHYESLWEKNIIAATHMKNILNSLKSFQVRKKDFDEFVLFMSTTKSKVCDEPVTKKLRSSTEFEDVPSVMLWSSALSILENSFDLIPRQSFAASHVPLSQVFGLYVFKFLLDFFLSASARRIVLDTCGAIVWSSQG